MDSQCGGDKKNRRHVTQSWKIGYLGKNHIFHWFQRKINRNKWRKSSHNYFFYLSKVAGQLRTDEIFVQGLGERKDFVGEMVGCGAAVPHVELDAKVGVGTAGVVARRQDDAARRLVLSASQPPVTQ